MGMRDSYLFPTLEAGSSRVFNVCQRTRELITAARLGGEEAEPALFFRTKTLNRAVLVKEARPNPETSRYRARTSVGTKIYFPYNPEDLYEGGKSVFIDDPKIEEILRDHAGLDLRDGNDDAKKDWAVIKMLDQIPSLDPFLVKDKLAIEGVEANEAYLEISAAEWDNIRAHVSEKLRPIITFAFPDGGAAEGARAETLVNKLWSTKDIDALMPIVNAFELPVDEASGIFAAWKGIMYYDYEYARSEALWTDCLDWLRQDAKPVEFVDRGRREMLGTLLGIVTAQFLEAWAELRAVFDGYDTAYNKLFVTREEAGPFVQFMRNAVQSYWILGARMSAINHCAAVWDILTGDSFKRRLKFEPLYALLELQHDILEEAR
jgi:hypothetical protein